MAFLDIKSAFDSAWRPAIVAALAAKDCPGYLLRIINDFLSERTATICHQGKCYECTVTTGCPQGSVLSPFLWNVLLDPALGLQFPFRFKLVGYADDLTAAVSHKDPAVATERLRIICQAFIDWARTVKLTINAIKTVFSLFSRRHWATIEDIRLTLAGSSLKPSTETRYLGLTLDWRLSWRPHIEARCLAATRLGLMVRRHIGKNWGLSGERIRTVYSTVVEPTINYCCSVWCAAPDRRDVVTLLRKTQRTFGLAICRAFRSVSTEAVLNLAGLLPIDLRVKELSARRLLALGMPFSHRSRSALTQIVSGLLETEEPEKPFFSADFPPWQSQRISEPVLLPRDGPIIPLIADGPSAARVFTDGAVLGGRAGYGVVICSAAGITATCRGRVDDHCSVIQAEGAAIREALDYLSTTGAHLDRIDLFVDSQTAIQLCTSTKKTSTLFNDIRRRILERPGRVRFLWLPGYAGQPGNELADRLAKEGALGLPTVTDHLPKPRDGLRAALHSRLALTWEKEWKNRAGAMTTRAFLPSTSLPPALRRFPMSSQLAQLLTGHSYLRGHLFRFQLVPSSICQCGGGPPSPPALGRPLPAHGQS